MRIVRGLCARFWAHASELWDDAAEPRSVADDVSAGTERRADT
jgi:hypothetical protein